MNGFEFHENMAGISFRKRKWRDSYEQQQYTVQEENLLYLCKEQGAKYCKYTASKTHKQDFLSSTGALIEQSGAAGK